MDDSLFPSHPRQTFPFTPEALEWDDDDVRFWARIGSEQREMMEENN